MHTPSSHHNGVYYHHLRKFPHTWSQSAPTTTPWRGNHLASSHHVLVLPVMEHQRNGITRVCMCVYIGVYIHIQSHVRLIPLVIFWDSFMLLQVLILYSFYCWVINIPAWSHTTFYLPIDGHLNSFQVLAIIEKLCSMPSAPVIGPWKLTLSERV